MSSCILIFVKAPVAGFVKTRLVPPLTPAQAADLYRAMAQDTLETARQVPDAEIHVAYQPHPQMPDPCWLIDRDRHPRDPSTAAQDGERESNQSGDPGSLLELDSRLGHSGITKAQVGWFLQDGQDLGERLAHASVTVFTRGHGPVVAIGSDLPALTSALIEKAFGLLQSAPIVLGPSEDGGYYLIGMQELQRDVFQNIPWSGPIVLDETIKKLKTLGLPYKLLPRRADLDLPEDLDRLRQDPARLAPSFQRTAAFLRAQL